jgi:hypothetical protein
MKFREEKVIVRDTETSSLLPGTIFNEIVKSGQLRACFPYEPKMRDSELFIKRMKDHCHLYAVYYSNILCGAAWITYWEHKTARLTFATFKTSARLYFHEIMKETAKQLIHLKDPNENFYYDSLYGIIEENNKKVIRAVRLSGLKKTGFIPNFYGIRKNAVIFALTRNCI